MADRSDKYYHINETIAYNVHRLRFIHGITQKELATRIGAPFLTISRLETLRIQKVNGKILNAIEDYFRVGRGFLDKEPAVYDVPYPKFVIQREVPRRSNFCRICGTKLFEDSIYCHKCGTKVLP